MKLISTREAAARLGQKPATLRAWRMEQRGPAYVPINSRNVKYPEDGVDKYAADRLVIPCGGGIERVNGTR